LLELAFSTTILLGWTLLGGLGGLDRVLLGAIGEGRPLLQQLALLAAFAAVAGLLDLPFGYYRTFVLEARFGFNKMTPGIWLADQAKAWLLAAAIGLPLALLVLVLMAAAGSAWWLWLWGVFMAFNLLTLLLYPTVIAPLFNQFKPIEDASLIARVTALMQRCGFAAKGLFVMDGSLLAGLIARSKNPADYKIVGEVLSVEPIAIMVRKDDAELKKIVDRTVAAMVKSGEIYKLYDKWFLEPTPPTGAKVGLPMSDTLKDVLKNPNDKPMEDYAAK